MDNLSNLNNEQIIELVNFHPADACGTTSPGRRKRWRPRPRWVRAQAQACQRDKFAYKCYKTAQKLTCSKLKLL